LRKPILSPDDPRLEGWYHTVELGDGLCSKGTYDLRETVDMHLPGSLEGKTALDVGTCNGFWAFEMEKRGADVTAIDVETWADFDLLPWVREAKGPEVGTPTGARFRLAHAERGSNVKRHECSVYDLSPDIGTFDFVFCGSLLLHLQNPLKALVNIQSVTREKAVIATLHEEALEQMPDRPLLEFGHRWADLHDEPLPGLGASCVYWRMNTAGLRELMEYAGFARTEPMGVAPLPPTEVSCVIVAGYPSH
jgi:tRNA (mo5U34)-methyltransferase